MAEIKMANRARRPAKRVEPDLAVLVDVRSSVLHAGDLHLEESHGQFQAQFRYTPAYLDQALLGDAFALDPINLPLKDDVFTTTSRYHRLGALFDAAPDAWGRTIMANVLGTWEAHGQKPSCAMKRGPHG